ncbi:MAG: M4 family metallopeptidase [Cyanobacteria bacterium J06560_6]
MPIAAVETAYDSLGNSREFSCTKGNPTIGEKEEARILRCSDLGVGTHDFRGSDSQFLNRPYIRNPPKPWDRSGVSAHANTLEVAKFINEVLEQNGIDDNGIGYTSFVHYPEDNAFWHPAYNVFAYGIRKDETEGDISYAASISIVAHEIFHGVTHYVAGLGCEGQSGALNESYSDIFGILLSNRREANIAEWSWELGIQPGPQYAGFPVRDLSAPSTTNQPEHMERYVKTKEDQGGVHINNGIHNKAAYNLLTSKRADGRYIFDADTAGLLFYLALRRLSRYSEFSDSRRALMFEASNCFRRDDRYREAVAAINVAFDSVGIR